MRVAPTSRGLDRHGEGGEYFYRWKNADLKIVGCADHVTEVMKALNEVQRGGKG